MPLASVPEGPVTVQESTSVPSHVMVERPPAETRVGFALMVTFGARTVTEADAGAESTPDFEQII